MAVPCVYEFRIRLKECKPIIWRRVQVPEEYTFWDLHVAIQDLMPWQDYHLHQFAVKNKITGSKVFIGTVDRMTGVTVNEREAKLKEYFIAPKDKCEYLYDFGFEWLHEVAFEAMKPAVAGLKYPICTAGKNLCYPEDGNGDPPKGKFDPKQVKFSDPEERWSIKSGSQMQL